MRPQGPVRWGERREVEGWGSVEGESPRDLAMTRVLPKKTLCAVVNVSGCCSGQSVDR